MEKIPGSVRFVRRNRHWQMLVEGPDWVISELVSEARERGLFILNWGGESGSSTLSTLIGTSPGGSNPYEPARQAEGSDAAAPSA